MKLLTLEKELKRLVGDRTQIEINIIEAEETVEKLKTQRDMILGAIQTTNFFITQQQKENAEEGKIDNSAKALDKNNNEEVEENVK